MRNLREDITELFREAQAPLVARLDRAWRRRRAARLEMHREYYEFVRKAPARRSNENAAARAKRQAARLALASNRPPCPHCGSVVIRDAIVPRGRKLPKYCSRKCMRAAVWRRYSQKARAQ